MSMIVSILSRKIDPGKIEVPTQKLINFVARNGKETDDVFIKATGKSAQDILLQPIGLTNAQKSIFSKKVADQIPEFRPLQDICGKITSALSYFKPEDSDYLENLNKMFNAKDNISDQIMTQLGDSVQLSKIDV